LIVFLSTHGHTFTHAALGTTTAAFDAQTVSYPAAFASTSLPRATYVFTDFDRLSPSDLAAAAALYRCLRAAGARVLNDPARAPSRYGLLRLLHEHGINRFDAYRVEERVEPERWPVFLRTEGGHGLPVSDLLHDPQALHDAIEHAVAEGVPRSALLIIEFAAEPVRPGLYRKLSAFRVGDRCFAHSCVHDEQWLVKYGRQGVATAELYEDELRIVRENAFSETLNTAFALAEIDYGRADFGLLGGEVQVYEINTNPSISFPAEHPSPFRIETFALTRRNYLAALEAIDTRDAAPPIPIASPRLERFQEAAARERARNVARRLN